MDNCPGNGLPINFGHFKHGRPLQQCFHRMHESCTVAADFVSFIELSGIKKSRYYEVGMAE